MNIQSRRRRLLAAMGLGLLLGGLASCHYGSDYTFPTFNVPNSVAIADVDGDGIPDLLVATTADQGNVQNPGFANVILGNHSSPGTFRVGETSGFIWWPTSLPGVSRSSCTERVRAPTRRP